MNAPKKPRPTIVQALDSLAENLDHALLSHPPADRVQGRLNVAEAVCIANGCLRRIAEAMERLTDATHRQNLLLKRIADTMVPPSRPPSAPARDDDEQDEDEWDLLKAEREADWRNFHPAA